MMTQTQTIDFNSAYSNYSSMVSRIARGYGFSDASQDDIVQDVFTQAWNKLDTLRDPACFPGWIKTIARNTCLNEIRRKRTENRNLRIVAAEETIGMNLGSDDETPLSQLKVESECVRVAIESLSNAARAEAARRYYLYDEPVKSIADSMGINQNTVLSHLRRFRLTLAKALVECPVNPVL